MSGHSKWATIHRKKGELDAARGKVFQKIAKEIYVAAKGTNGNPDDNPGLRAVLEKARSNNMPKDNIQKAIDKAVGGAGGEEYESVRYEGYGPSGVAVIVEASTDNKNRTAADVRHVFDKAGGNLGTTGCVSYLFNKKGVIVIERASTDRDEEELMMLALDAGAEDFEASEEVYEITTDPADFSAVREKLEEEGFEFLEAEVQMVPTTMVSLDEKGCEKMERLIEKLEDLDDVANIYHNWEQE